jgi:hypothetical protein
MFRSLVALFWVSLSIIWIFFDKGIRDGDEEGHVGTAEMFQQWLSEGQYQYALNEAWKGDTGEYPPLGSAIVGAWWWAAERGQPGDPQVRAILLSSLLLAAWSTASLLRQEGQDTDPARSGELLTFLAVLSLPLANGLSRHFMPEGLLVGVVALAILAAVRAVEYPGPWRAIGLGLVLGAGMLVKQTFVFYICLPLTWILGPLILRRPLLVLLSGGTAAVLCLPWYTRFWTEQMDYGAASAESASQAGLSDQLLFYPGVLWWQGLGPVLFIATLAVLMLWARERVMGERKESIQSRRLVLALIWLLGGLLILVLIPKKYPRLIAPLTPAAALIIGSWTMRRAGARWIVPLCGILLFGWLALSSTQQHKAPEIVEIVDPGCIQHWIRPPMETDLGLHAASVALRARPDGTVWVEGSPEIPCSLQTTHPWAYHLDPYLRREGMDREVMILTDDQPIPQEAPSSRLVWNLEPPDVEVPELGGGFQVLGAPKEEAH